MITTLHHYSTHHHARPQQIILCGPDYPLLLIAIIKHKASHQYNLPVSTIDTVEVPLAHAQLTLQTSFLGQENLYWLKNMHALNAHDRTAWQSFLKKYQGPHTLIYYTNTEPDSATDRDTIHTITLPATVDLTATLTLSTYCTGKQPRERFWRPIFRALEQLNIETAVLLTHYEHVTGLPDSTFIQWVRKLQPQRTSLFTLSQYFFNRQAAQFFTLWKLMINEYGPEFWLVYWHEQLWQASWYVYYMHKQQPAKAKDVARRLPFTFLQQGWKRFTTTQLAQWHAQLYELDCAYKSGGDGVFLELFLSNCMSA